MYAEPSIRRAYVLNRDRGNEQRDVASSGTSGEIRMTLFVLHKERKRREEFLWPFPIATGLTSSCNSYNLAMLHMFF